MMRMRKKKNLAPRMEACSKLWIREPVKYKGKWRDLKPDSAMLRLELGCGKGRFTAETAAAHQSDLYIAMERVPDAMVIAMERCRDLGLNNVFFIDGDAAALSDYFAPNEVDLIYINFCDPWPSLKHARRRLTHEGFLREYRQVLKDGGQIHFKTDNQALFEWSLFQFPKAGFALSEVTRNLHEHGVCGVMTDYENKFHSLGLPIHRCVGTKSALPDVPLTDSLCELLPKWEIRPVEEPDLEQVLALLKSDSGFFAPDGQHPSAHSLCTSPAGLPSRCSMEQVHNLALWQDGKPQVVLNLVEGYPRKHTLFVGIFLVDPILRCQGVGRTVIHSLVQAAGRAGMDRVRLACPLTSPNGHAFCQAVGFRDVREGQLSENGRPVWLMEQLTGRLTGKAPL